MDKGPETSLSHEFQDKEGREWALKDLALVSFRKGLLRISNQDSGERSVIGALSSTMAASTHLLLAYLEWVASQVTPLTADEKVLEDWAKVYNLPRKPATPSHGKVRVEGSEKATILQGVLLCSEDGTQFEVTSDAALRAKEGELGGFFEDISVKALEPGPIYVLQGKELRIQSSILGVHPIAKVAEPITGGVEREALHAFRERFLSRIQEPPMGGSRNDYIQWTKQVPGVTRAWCFPCYGEPGTVGVSFVLDGLEDIFPDEAKLEEMRKYLEDPSRKPVTSKVVVFSPRPKKIDVQLKIKPDTLGVREGVVLELKDLFSRVKDLGQSILFSQIHEAVSLAPGLEDFKILSPTENVEVGKTELPVLGNIEFQGL